MSVRGGWPRVLGQSVYSRCWWLACILMVECIVATALPHPWLQGKSVMVTQGQPVTINPLPFRWLQARTVTTSTIFFCVALLFFGRDKLRAAQWDAPPVRKGWALLHLCALVLFAGASFIFKHFLYLNSSFAMRGSPREHGLVCVWGVLLAFIPATLLQSLLGIPKLLLLARSLDDAWGLAALCDVLMMAARSLLILLWDRPHSWLGHRLQAATFRGVKFLLGLFYPDVFRDPAHFMVGTRGFFVVIADQCSGVEGLALILSLTVGWILYTRRELRLGRAILLVPISLLLSWLLNLVRIAGLIAIGNAGYRKVAMVGFHSQAGWILFNCVALGFLLTVNNVAWFRQPGATLGAIQSSAPQVGSGPLAGTNVAAVYLVPLLAFLGAGLLAQATSNGFEWMYALRPIAALAAFYVYRRQYRGMDWHFGWLGPLVGVAVFAFWVALDHWIGWQTAGSGAASTGVAEGLAQLSAGQRAAWIVPRAITAAVMVPFAEELAFRGYIARRLMSADVQSVPFGSLSLFAVLASSLAFGILHGRMWLAGTLAGVLYAAVAKLRGRLGEAVAAHATANLLIALWVVARGDYSLW